MPDVLPYESLTVPLQEALSNESTRTVCPRCGGGSQRELSLSIRREDEHLTKLSCWRATCGWWAFVVSNGAKWHGKKMKERLPFDQPTIPLQGEPLSILKYDYGLRPSAMNAHGWRLLEQDGTTLVMPVRDFLGRQIGYVTRTLSKPKRVMSYPETAQPFLDNWCGPGSGEPPVIVEDCLSACRLWGMGYSAVALMGTNMSNADARYIADSYGKKAYLALDADAWSKSLKLQERHAHVLTMLPIPLTLDIKDIEYDDDIKKIFGFGA